MYKGPTGPTTTAKDIGGVFVKAIIAMPNLRELHVDLIYADFNDISLKLRAAFRASQPVFRSIKLLKLVKVSNAAFLIDACISLRTLIVDHPQKYWKRTLATLANRPGVCQVELDSNGTNWTASRFNGSSTPEISTLL
jgi:hypothetical protein